MSSGRRDIPPPRARAGPSGSGSGLNSADEASNEAQPSGVASTDAPQFEWVYNSDHTDPQNFGFMFLKPVGTRLTRTNAGPSEVPLRTPTTSIVPPQPPNVNTRAFSSSASASSVSRVGSVKGSQPFDTRHVSSSVSPTGTTSPSNNPKKQPTHTPHPRRSPSETSSQDSTHHTIPFRASPHFGTSANIPPQQVTLPESLQWTVTPVTQALGLPQAYHQPVLRGGIDLSSRGSIGPTSSVPTTFTAHEFIPPTSLPAKGKRKLATSPVISQPANILKKPSSFQQILRKRRLHLDANDPTQESWETNLSLCTRCHHYLIPGSDPGLCTSCLQESDIYKWPSISSSRMENLESLVLFLMPSHMEECLRLSADTISRGRSWRPLAYKIPNSGNDLSKLVFQDQWTLSKQQIRSIGLFGSDYEELADIAQTFQRSVPVRNICLEAACTTLIAVCDLYKCIIAPPNPNGIRQTTPVSEVISHVRTVRITLLNALQQLNYLALSPSTTRSRQDWLPAFLSASILATTAIIFLDILGQFPSPYREQIWGDNWHNRIVEMRNGGYGILLNLLRSNTNGVNPLKMDCWGEESDSKPKPKVDSSAFIISTPKTYTKAKGPRGLKGKGRGIAAINTKRADKIDTPSYFWDTPGSIQPTQDVLLGNQSPAALEGLVKLKTWQKTYGGHLKEGENMFAKELYALAMIRPIAALSKVFNFEEG